MPTIKTFRASELDERMLDAWRNIQNENPEFRHPLLCPEFTIAVADVREDVEIAVFFNGTQAVGFFPYHRDRNNVAFPIADEVSDFHAVVIAPELVWEPEEILRELKLVAFNFHHLPVFQKEFTPYHALTDPAYYMNIENGYEEYVAGRKLSGTSVISQANRKRRKIEREIGDIRFDFHCQDPEVLSRLVEWKLARLKHQGFPNSFRNRWVNEFTKRLQHTHSEHFSGVLSCLFAGNYLIAAHLGSRSPTILSSWIPGHSPEFEAYSPGLVLTLEIAKSAANRGIQAIDLGRGRNPLKTRLASSQLTLTIGEVETRRLRRFVNGSLHRIKALSHRFPFIRSAVQVLRKKGNFDHTTNCSIPKIFNTNRKSTTRHNANN